MHETRSASARVVIPVDGQNASFSATLLRDLCNCPHCVHESTRQRLYSTADIPAEIQAETVQAHSSPIDAIDIQWKHDVPGSQSQHKTRISIDTLRSLAGHGVPTGATSDVLPKQTLWDGETSNPPDFDYDSYMTDDDVLLRVMQQLRTHGLVFITNTPGIEKSVSTIAERIGPVKDTFYGYTWDVRSVPAAINAAYTSGDLGFHTDLLYFQNPPHVQLLHCIQSSSTGGASVFADAYKAALDLYDSDIDAFNVLADLPVNYHYEHPDSNLYRTTKPVIDLRPLRIGGITYSTLPEYLAAWEKHRQLLQQSSAVEMAPLEVGDCIEKINWGPPFMAPFSLDPTTFERTRGSGSVLSTLNDKIDRWHAAAQKFNSLLHRPQALHERLMKPGDCVLFDNTRVLHARRAFHSDDIGKARWLRGTYVDKDPYLSKLRVLKHQSKNSPAVRALAEETMGQVELA